MIKRLLLLFCIYINCQAFALDYPARPEPPKLVNDFTNTLTAAEQSQLESKLVAFNDCTSIQIAVVIMKTLDGYPLSDYAFELAQKWGIGQKETNNGVLLLISMDEHKLFIATGYGMEGVMPDVECKHIVDFDITPLFRQGLYYEGIDVGTSRMMSLAKGEYTATGTKGKQTIKRVSPYGFILILIVIILVFVFKVRSVRSYANLNSISFWAAWMLLNAASRRQTGQWKNFHSGSGGFGGFGGGGGGGGFGGFGGGSFGGGGAGGSW